jgi:hypothetical protein
MKAIQQMMSGNIQEMTRSLQTAESGASNVLITLDRFNSIPTSGNFEDFSYNATGPNDELRATARIHRAIDVQITNNMTQRGNRPVSGH